MNINGNHLFGRKKRMAALADMDKMLFIKKRHGSILFHSQGSLGKYKVQKSHDPLVFRQLIDMKGGLAAEVCKDSFYFFLFLQGQFL